MHRHTHMATTEGLLKLFNSPLLTETLSRKGVTWKFIKKHAPWCGGLWERLIALTKTALKKYLDEPMPIYLREIEVMLNDCPITYVLLNIRK